MTEIQRVLIVGAGTMGHGFAQVMAMNRLDVSLVDQTEEMLARGRGWITESLNNMIELGHVQKEEIEGTLSRIHFTTDLEEAAAKADFVLEAIVENVELKKALFRELGGFTDPRAIIASNTSSFDINELSAVTAHPERVLGAHWFHPPQITPCVEVIPAEPTSREITERTIQFLERIGKAPTLCRSAPGFVANRIQVAMAAEALAIVQEGLATPEEVDRIVKSSFGFRLSAYGPFEICDQAGADTYYAIFEYLYGKLKREQFKPPRILAEQVRRGRFGLKTLGGFYDYKDGAAESIKRERDRKLFARLNLFRQEQE
jgi:3-hydroxybutyryl-CoA dehydrogenase